MHHAVNGGWGVLAAWDVGAWLVNSWAFLKVLIGFSIIIFVHELGHFLAAKWVGVRVDRFSVGFGYRLFGWRRGEGFTFGSRPNYTADELRERSYGETDYCFKALPFGGYVKMLGQDDIDIDEKTGEVQLSKDPRAFTSRPVGQRMIVVSAGVVFNLLFAALLLMCVFLIGKNMLAPVIGKPQPGSPASKVDLRPGDRILEINGEHIDSFNEFGVAQALADGPLRLKVRHTDGQIADIEVMPERIGDTPFRTIGVPSIETTELGIDTAAQDGQPGLRRGDRIVAVNGQKVQSTTDVGLIVWRNGGQILDLTVERPDPKNPQAAPQTFAHRQRAVLLVDAADPPKESLDRLSDSQHILGLLQRREISDVQSGSAAAQAGLKPGDVITHWGGFDNPRWSQIVENTQANADRPIPIRVRRKAEGESGSKGPGEKTTAVSSAPAVPQAPYQDLEFTLTPRRPFRLWGSAPAQVGIISRVGEAREAVVADVADGTPAAALADKGLVGAKILDIDGHPIQTWFDVAEALKRCAGRTVKIKYDSRGDVVTNEFAVPGSIVNELDLPPGTLVLSITDASGKTHDHVTLDDGSTAKLASGMALRRWLREHIGETVEVRYAVLQPTGRPEEEQRKKFTVRPDNTDPWQMRIIYTVDLTFTRLMEPVSAHGNPVRALWMGVRFTYKNIVEIYQVLKHMAKRNVGTENVSGPIGIFNQATEEAKKGLGDLLHFLAFLSINLAVLNFLPFPLVDGGLMVFLILEKIRGKPLSIKTQMAVTLVGLAVILLCFVLVTVQDITRLFQ